ncbi:MAG: circularly permuted type 2 ATP-grasp protein [Pseudomonadota bacterium]
MLTLSDVDPGIAEIREALLAGYRRPMPGVHDELLAEDGSVRPHWQRMIDWLAEIGRPGYEDASADLLRLRTESGIAFAANGAPDAEEDTLPVILTDQDWQTLEDGILQRARLADAAVTDVYTDRRTLGAGLLPPGLVYGGPAFAAHCAGWSRPPRNWVHIYEADVGRTADGRWVILGDRVDTPLGDGWLLSNRIATSQAFADPFIELGVRRLASHYARFQDHLGQMMGWDGRLALLTSGEKDPRFFSHAYFARYMDAALIEPADLTVRDGSAFVKTLGGLRRIDVLLRGVSDASVDALHRPGRAAFGAPALSLAARSGSLKIVNGIGSAVMAHRALAPYAHRLAQFLLGEDLLLNDAPCLWLGGARARRQVLDEREAWRIVPLNSRDALLAGGAEFGVTGGSGDGGDIETLLGRFGERFCAVQSPELAETAFWTGDGLTRAPWMMRVFASRTQDGWSVAPGGVATRVPASGVPSALGFGKDVWVLPGTDPTAPSVTTTTRLDERFAQAHLRRTGRDLLSRVADELFWLGRNAERAESVLRVLGVCVQRHLDGNRTDSDPDLLCDVIEIHAAKDDTLNGAARYRDAIHRLTRGEEISSVPSILQILRSGGMRARASISSESWRYIERLCSDRRWQARGALRQNAGLVRLIEDSLQALAAFAGSAQENLTRNYAWRFLEIGRRLERGVQIAAVAEQMAARAYPQEESRLRAWLTLSDSSSAYRSRYMMTVQPAAVLDLLILDETNPRSLAYQIERLESVLHELPTEVPYRRPEHRRALKLLTDLRLFDADALAVTDEDGLRPVLTEFLTRCLSDLAEISDLISRAFFAHADAPEALLSQARLPHDEEAAE